MEKLQLKDAKEQKTKPTVVNRTNLKYRKSTSSTSPKSMEKTASNIQIVQPMQLESNSSPTTIPMVRTNNTTKLRSLAAHNIRNNNTNSTTTTSSASTGSATGKFFSICFIKIMNNILRQMTK